MLRIATRSPRLDHRCWGGDEVSQHDQVLEAALLNADCPLPRVGAADLRPFTVRDAIEMAYFGNISTSSPSKVYDDGAVSPDGRFAIKITHRGVLPDGDTEGTIWLFNVADVIRSIRDQDTTPSEPIQLVRMSAAINGYPNDFQDWNNTLLHPRWSDDSKSVLFLGRDGQENRRLYRVDIESQEVTALSPANRDVFGYSISGQHTAFLAGRDIDAEQLWQAAGSGVSDIFVGTGTPLIPLLFPHFRGYANVEPLKLEVWQVREDSAGPVRDETSGDSVQVVSRLNDADISISPDGSQAAVVIADSAVEQASGRTFRIIDLQSGNSRDTADLEAAGLEWTPFAAGLPSNSGSLRFDVSESLNQPPVLVATLNENGESRTVFDPNPQLADVSLAPVTVFE
jgi:hypothetical protein